MRVLRWIGGLTVILGAMATGPAFAATSTCVAPPGSAAVDQYCELVQDAGGDRPAAAPPQPAPIPSPAGARLGPVALAEIGVQPVRPTRASHHSVPAVVSKPPAGVIRAVGNGVGLGSTAGAGFVLVLLLAGAAVGAWAFVARRRASQGRG